MSEETEASPQLELEKTDIYSQYFLYAPTEIVFVLRAAMQKNCMATVYFDMGQSFFLTSVVEVSQNGLILDYGNHEETNIRALQSTRLICTLSIEKVKVQFALPGVSRIIHDGRPAFGAELPKSLLRLQRREYFRISTPIGNPVFCEIQEPEDCPEGEKTSFPLKLPLVDISAGGVGLLITHKQTRPFDHDAVFKNCVLHLPESGPMRANLHVRTVLEVTGHSGNRNFRVGCAFVDMSRSLQPVIQRYITTLERGRKARSSGLE